MNNIGLSFIFLCLFTISNYLRPGFWLGESYSNLPMIFGVLSVVSFVVFDLKKVKKKIFINWSVLLIFAVYLFSCYSTFVETVDSVRSEEIFYEYLTKGTILYFMIVYIVNTQKKYKIYFYVLTVGAFLLAYRYINYPVWHHGRAWLTGSALTTDPNGVSILFLYTMPLALALFMATKSRLMKIALIYCCLVIMLGVIEGRSRGGFLALITLCGLTIFIVPKSIGGKIKVFLILAPVLALIMFRYAPPGYIYRMQEIFEPESDPTGSAYARAVAMSLATNYITAHPISEYGIGNHSYYLAEQLGIQQETNDIFRGGTLVHNFFLQYGADAGSIPMIIFLCFIVSIGCYARKVDKGCLGRNDSQTRIFNMASFLSYTVFVVGALFLPWAYSLFLFYVAGLCTAQYKIAMTEKYYPDEYN